MRKLKSWIIRHQVVSFYLITFALMYGLGFSFKAVMIRNEFLMAPFLMIALCSPALTGILISALINRQPRQGSRKAFWITFGVAWLIAALVFNANNKFFNHAPLSPMLILITSIVVLPVAFVIACANSRIPRVRSYLGSLIRLRGVWGWALLALATTLTLIFITMVVKSLITGIPLKLPRFPDKGWALLGLIVLKLLYQLLFFNATGEEAGWRGFAQPRLQARFSPLVAALILAVLWAPWHFFFWQAEGREVLSVGYWLDQYKNLIPGTFFMVWFYNRSKGSILVAGIMHAAANTAFFFINNLDGQTYLIVQLVVVLILILVERMWKKLPADHPAVYRYKSDREDDLITGAA